MSANKITHEAINELFKYFKKTLNKEIRRKYIDKVKREFCCSMNKLKNYVYWRYNFENEQGNNDFMEGLITVKQYNYLFEQENKGRFNFRSTNILKHKEFDLDDITFSKKLDDILRFAENEQHDDGRLMYRKLCKFCKITDGKCKACKTSIPKYTDPFDKTDSDCDSDFYSEPDEDADSD